MYRGRQLRLNRPVAVKILKQENPTALDIVMAVAPLLDSDMSNEEIQALGELITLLAE